MWERPQRRDSRDAKVLPTFLLFGHFAAPAQYLRLRPGGFGFLDVPGAIVKQRETGPADLVVRPKLYGFFSCFDRFCEAAEFHQRHAERVPAVKEIGRDVDTAPVFRHCTFEIADGDVATRVVKDFI